MLPGTLRQEASGPRRGAVTDACGPPTPPVPRPRTRQGGGLGSGCSRPLPAASGAGPWAEDTLRPVTFARNKRIGSPAGSPGSGRGPTPAGFAFPAVKDRCCRTARGPRPGDGSTELRLQSFLPGEAGLWAPAGVWGCVGEMGGAEAQASQRGTAGAARNPGPTSEPPAELQAGGWLCSGEDEPA